MERSCQLFLTGVLAIAWPAPAAGAHTTPAETEAQPGDAAPPPETPTPDAEPATPDAESATPDAESATPDAEAATTDAEAATTDGDTATSPDTPARDEGDRGPGSPAVVPFEDSFPALRTLGLLLVAGVFLVYGGIAVWRRFGRGNGVTAGRRIRIADTVSLGGKRYLCTVETRGRALLVGISGDRIQLLTDLGPAEASSFEDTLARAARNDANEESAS